MVNYKEILHLAHDDYSQRQIAATCKTRSKCPTCTAFRSQCAAQIVPPSWDGDPPRRNFSTATAERNFSQWKSPAGNADFT